MWKIQSGTILSTDRQTDDRDGQTDGQGETIIHPPLHPHLFNRSVSFGSHLKLNTNGFRRGLLLKTQHSQDANLVNFALTRGCPGDNSRVSVTIRCPDTRLSNVDAIGVPVSRDLARTGREMLCRWMTTLEAHGCHYHGPLTIYVKLGVAHAPGIPGTFSPPLTFKGNRQLAIPVCTINH